MVDLVFLKIPRHFSKLPGMLNDLLKGVIRVDQKQQETLRNKLSGQHRRKEKLYYSFFIKCFCNDNITASLMSSVFSINANPKTAYDPVAMENAGFECKYTTLDALKDADVALILTAWNEFKDLEIGTFEEYEITSNI